VTLHVGLGTFQPLRKDQVEQNQLHSEHYEISTAAADAINRAKAEGRRVVAVGTTSVRTLEAAASRDNAPRVMPGSGEASLFIYPGFNFQIADALLTNFHLPRSSLLILVCAFTGKDTTLQAYAHAVEQGYRFFSYGDCMFIED
jgi:S-adenosylmethionine:tRNA ribosyltransferase-isomerase